MPLELQPKLLRVLENGEFQRVGETQSRRSNARIVAATNRDLKREVREGRFRADLYHRLSVFSILVPPLREMGRDRQELLEHFRQRYAQQSHLPPFQLDEPARALWDGYAFPGNVRELRNIVIRLTAKYPGQTVTAEQLAGELDLPQPDTGPRHDQPVTPDIRAAREHLQQAPAGFDLDQHLARWEKAYVEAALQITQGNLSQAARLLGINRTTLHARRDSLERLPSQDQGNEDRHVP